jgi:oligopeptide/dipeptide ABC transporter ATP-binding protein
LMASIPKTVRVGSVDRKLPVIPGSVPGISHYTAGCRFKDRCSFRMDICGLQEPPLMERIPGHNVSCWFIENSG